jgi:hypothetical protein
MQLTEQQKDILFGLILDARSDITDYLMSNPQVENLAECKEHINWDVVAEWMDEYDKHR